MSDEEAFLHEIQSDPFSDFAYLVYADWLDEQGDLRSEYLRTVVALDRITENDQSFDIVQSRERELRAQCDPLWLDDLTGATHLSLWSEWDRLTRHEGITQAKIGLSPLDRRVRQKRCLRNLMRRARRAIEQLTERLMESGYLFVRTGKPHIVLTADDLSCVREFETKSGLHLPWSLKMWLEEVGLVNFMGTHPDWPCTAYCFSQQDRARPAWRTDPLVIDYCVDDLRLRLGEDATSAPMRTRFLTLAPDIEMKANLEGEAACGVLLSHTPCADSLYSSPTVNLMNHWRDALRWGGFPGFSAMQDAPYSMLDELCNDLPKWD